MSSKRRRQASSSSSVSSYSLGVNEEDNPHRYNSHNNNSNSNSNSNIDNSNSSGSGKKNKRDATTTPKATKSIFSGFWPNSELEDVNKENDRTKNNDHGTRTTGNNNNNRAPVYYEGFDLTIGSIVYEIGVGDVVAMRNTGTEDDEVNDDEQHQHQQQQQQQQQQQEEEEGRQNENSRERRRRRRQDRESQRTAEEAAAAKESGGGGVAAKPLSSEYAVDAEFDEASDYYQAAAAATANDDNENDAPAEIQAGKPKASEDMDATTDAGSSTSPNLAASAPTKDGKVGDGLMLARVERIWQDKGYRGRVLFKARWFLKKEDVDSLPLGEITGPISAQDFAANITEHDLVLSNQSDDNHVTTICDLVQVLYRKPNLGEEMPSAILPATYLCRYSLCIDDDPKVVVLPYTGEEDEWKEMTTSALGSKKRRVENNPNPGGNTGSGGGGGRNYLQSADYGTESGNKKRRRVGDFADEKIDEGTTELREIQVGRDHQVVVPPFVPNQKIVSRNPIRMWKPDKISQEGTDDYIEEASQILTPFLREHHLTQEEPYAPFPTERMEELSKSMEWKRLPTLSSVSTVSSLTTDRVDALREVNIDALLRNLHVSNYNVKAAIAAIEASPRDYIIAWTPHEKARFNTGFRRYSGSLRAIFKGMGNKALQEVIDYHYRFKIPDQFRRFQERKREQAIRMLECIETRRNVDCAIVVSQSIVGPQTGGAGEKKDGNDWMKAVSSVAVSVEERRVKAKKLLEDVDKKLGRNKMMKVFEVFKNADETTMVQSKTKLLEIFREHQEFQSRFLEFLPQTMRL